MKDEQPQPELAEHDESQQAEPLQDGLAEEEGKTPIEDCIAKKYMTIHAQHNYCRTVKQRTLKFIKMDYIDTEHVWITRAKDNTYIQAMFGTPREKAVGGDQ